MAHRVNGCKSSQARVKGIVLAKPQRTLDALCPRHFREVAMTEARAQRVELQEVRK